MKQENETSHLKLNINHVNKIVDMINHMNRQQAICFSGGIYSRPTKKQRLLQAELDIFRAGYKKHIADLGISERYAAAFIHLVNSPKFINELAPVD